MATNNRLDMTQGYFGHYKVIDHNENGVAIVQWESFSLYQQAGRWEQWLEHGEPFKVQGVAANGTVVSYTARCERAKGKEAMFWYGYRRIGGKLKKAYIGRSTELTLDRLRQVGSKLTDTPQTV